MKAVLKNTIVAMLCLAGVVLAAPTQSMSYPKTLAKTQNPANILVEGIQDQLFTAYQEPVVKPSIEEGTVRFACW